MKLLDTLSKPTTLELPNGWVMVGMLFIAAGVLLSFFGLAAQMGWVPVWKLPLAGLGYATLGLALVYNRKILDYLGGLA